MGLMTNILKEIPTNAVLREKLQQIEKKYEIIEAENFALKQKISKYENATGEMCPKCKQMSWQIEKSEPDKIFGAVGGMRRTYKCATCGFSEEEIVQ